jgi:hypothetical protein
MVGTLWHYILDRTFATNFASLTLFTVYTGFACFPAFIIALFIETVIESLMAAILTLRSGVVR